MSFLDDLREAFKSLVTDMDYEEDPEYRCIKCGADLQRNYNSCPECGRSYIAPLDPGDDGGE